MNPLSKLDRDREILRRQRDEYLSGVAADLPGNTEAMARLLIERATDGSILPDVLVPTRHGGEVDWTDPIARVWVERALQIEAAGLPHALVDQVVRTAADYRDLMAHLDMTTRIEAARMVRTHI